MAFTHAIVRRPGKDMSGGITTSSLGLPDYTTAMEQFDAYLGALTDCGLILTVLDPLEGYPDAHFVEDAAVVTPDIAVITNPGADAKGIDALAYSRSADMRSWAHMKLFFEVIF